MPHDKTTAPLPDLCPKRIALCSVGELFGGVERHILGLLDGSPTTISELLFFCFAMGNWQSRHVEKASHLLFWLRGTA